MMTSEKERPREVVHDESPSGITDHPFEPRGEWWTLCKHCSRAQAAHAETTVDGRRIIIGYYSDDNPDYE